ncbi:MAG: MGH1-like glycoside hydrolase domain-containing protein [Phycisphaerae bacterium]
MMTFSLRRQRHRLLLTLVCCLLALPMLIGSAVTRAASRLPIIGPFYTNDPEGLAVVPNAALPHPVGYNVSIGWVAQGHYRNGYWGLTRYQWHLQAMQWGKHSGISRMRWLVGQNHWLHLHWQRVTGTSIVVARLSADKTTQVVLECYPSWPGYAAAYRADKIGIVGQVTAGQSAAPDFLLTPSRAEDAFITAHDARSFAERVLKGSTATSGKSAEYAGMVFTLTPNHPLTFVAALSTDQATAAGSLASAKQVLSQGWAGYAATRPHASGDWGDFISPMSLAANEGALYLPPLRSVSATVARGWCLPYHCVLFEWDSFFNSMLLSINSPSVGPWMVRRQLAGIFHFQMPDGMVCNFSNDGGRIATSVDRSEPPVSSMCVWQAYQRWPSKSTLEAFYQPLVQYHHWWFAINPQTHLPYRDGNKDGLLEWGSPTGVWQNARFESGMDDSPMYVRGKVKLMRPSDTFNVDDVGLNSLWAADAMYLSKIAAALGHKNAAAHYAAECQTMSQRINAMLWSHKLGMYCNRYWSRGKGHHLLSRQWSPTNFYPMIAKVPDAGRADRMLAVLLNKKYFWGKWVLPTISRNNPAYTHQEYWQGDIWGPTNYLAFQGLLNYAPTDVLHAYARKSVRLFMNNWNKTGVWSENYITITGRASHDPHYSWGALLSAIGLQAICNIMPDNKVRLDGTWNMHAKLYNIPILGHRYTIIVQPKLTQLLRHRQVVAQAEGKVAFCTLPERKMP